MVKRSGNIGAALRRAAVALGAAGCMAPGAASAATAYAAMAPVGDYLMADRAEEIALARSAAPAAISGDAEVLVLGPHGYATAAPGKNGFVCLVQRSWFSGLADGEFWNPKERSPICFNRQGARSVLPLFLKRTEWALAGVSRDEMVARTKAGLAVGQFSAPEVGALTYMMSKDGYLNDDAHGPWHPHLMFFLPRMAAADWGANLHGSPVIGADGGVEPYTIFFVPVAHWSDGSPDGIPGAPHAM
jgi:hypothetical protein